jgi:lipoprotein NlpD
MKKEKDRICGIPRRLAALSFGTAVLSALLAACTVTSTREAPVADRSVPPRPAAAAPQPAATPPSATSDAVKPVGRVAAADGTYRVQPGDTLIAIAASFGRDPKELARWNNLADASRLQVGQVLRVVPPAETAAVVPVAPTSPATTRPLDAPAPAAATPPATPPATAPAVPAAGDAGPPGPVASIPPPPPPATAAPSSDWIWPANGRVVEKFDEKRNKGIGIAAKEGDPVVAAADGTVAYSGSGLRGYGNLVILRHDNGFVSAYAHNRQILVKQGQVVKRGQRIAEVGSTDTTEPKLHFEIRRQGTPVDPLNYLPPR